jgi:alanine dehydrogenase
VSARNCSTAATTAAASDRVAVAVTMRMLGLGGRRSPFLDMAAHFNLAGMPEVPVLDADAVLAAVSPPAAIERVRAAFERFAAGEWVMPAKVYLDAPPNGDFRAMPARGDGFALLKWVTSFPENSARGLPVVTGALLLSDAETGELRAIMDCAAVTSLRTGAAAALSAEILAAPGARSVGIIGCGVNGAWSARCLAAAGYGAGVCADARREAGEALARELGWAAGNRREAAAQDVVVTVTPGNEPVIGKRDLRGGQHIAALGADARGKAEVETAAFRHCHLFCDEWAQASAGGELSGAVSEGTVTRQYVTELGDVIAGRADGRRSEDEITLFDSTGLAIQDLAIAAAVYDAWREDRIPAHLVSL